MPKDQRSAKEQLKDLVGIFKGTKSFKRPGDVPQGSTDAAEDQAKRLQKLQGLYDQGLIDHEDYERQKRNILEGR